MQLTTLELAEQLGGLLLADGLQVATAESCTGGGVAAAITAVAGCSEWFGAGFVTYSNHHKSRLLGVREKTLNDHGAVSEAVVREMAAGALAGAEADVAVAVSGIAGPAGGSREKPVGTVWIGWATASGVDAELFHFAGDRAEVRRQSVDAALTGLIQRVKNAV